MNKILLGLILCAGLLSCSGNEHHEPLLERNASGYTSVIEIEGHKYIVARTSKYAKGGICIIHAESCDCKNINKED